MRVLKFIVNDTNIAPDPSCDFTELFPGREEQVQAEFTFSPEWEKRVKVAAFWSVTGTEYEPQPINSNNTCQIPVEALNKVMFKLQVLGKQRGSAIVKTNVIPIYQSGRRK